MQTISIKKLISNPPTVNISDGMYVVRGYCGINFIAVVHGQRNVICMTDDGNKISYSYKSFCRDCTILAKLTLDD